MTDQYAHRNVARLPGLDLFRFVAACTVFFGHAVYFSNFSERLGDKTFLDIIRTGTFAVDFFFLLSGYVLSNEKTNRRWFASRYLRLYPVYFLGILIGIFVNIVLHQSSGTTISGFLLTLIGVQVLFPEYSLAINAPLWSLSVEFLLTPLFLVFWSNRKSRVKMVLLLVISLVLSQLISGSVLCSALPFFTLGALLRNLNAEQRISTSKYANAAIFVTFVWYMIGGAAQIRRLDYSLFGISIKLLVLGCLIQCLIRMKFNPKIAFVSIELGKRSYVLYAIHAPLVGLFLAALKPSDLVGFLYYLLILVSTIIFLTELVYRSIERPTIKWARQKRR